MKPKFRCWLSAFIVAFISFAASSQTTENAPWTPDRGYWNVEENINDPFHHIVRFYNDDHQLIYMEALNNVKMNLEKQKTKMKLKKALEDALARWKKNRSPEANKGYVVAALK